MIDTGEAEARKNYPDTGEPEPVVPALAVSEGEIQEVEQKQGLVNEPSWLKVPANEPPWLTVFYTIFGFVVVYLLLRGLWLFIRS